MSTTPRPNPDDLLADRALVGLSSAEELALERQLDELGTEPGSGADESLALAAAELDRALAPALEPMPAALRARLLAAAEDFAPRTAPHWRSAPAARPERRLFALAGWLVAVAAGLLAVLASRPGEAPDVAEQRAELLARAGTLRLDCAPTEQAPGAGGDVAWSQELQRGVLHLRGLPPNDPAVEQYQLWIFDEGQLHPVDGGVFDVDAGEVLVPIDAKLSVQKPTLFAITVEKPGGVVVSDQKRIVLVAKLQ